MRRLLIGSLLLLGLAAPLTAQPVRVVLETEKGEIELEVDTVRAPITSANFLKYVDTHGYDGSVFHRSVTLQNQPGKTVLIQVIQGGRDPEKGAQDAPIPLERTSVTGIKHVDGALSMARDTPDSASSDFFICIGPQPELDFGGKRNPDGQGFAAFGKVVRGMDVVKRIQAAPADGQTLTPPIAILKARRVAAASPKK